MFKKLTATVLFVACTTTPSFASMPDPSSGELKAQINRTLQQGRSLKTFYTQLGADYGGAAVKPLIEICSDEHATDEMRWAALFGLARLAGKESIGIISRFMTHSSWMLRDAALKTAAALNATELTPQIEKRLKDDALIVRTTAVQTIAHLNLQKSAPRLVEALFDQNNFHGGKALWIHKHILQTLKDFHYSAAVPKLVELLQRTQDEKLQANVLQTLEGLTGRSFANKPLQEQIYLWKRNTVSELTF